MFALCFTCKFRQKPWIKSQKAHFPFGNISSLAVQFFFQNSRTISNSKLNSNKTQKTSLSAKATLQPFRQSRGRLGPSSSSSMTTAIRNNNNNKNRMSLNKSQQMKKSRVRTEREKKYLAEQRKKRKEAMKARRKANERKDNKNIWSLYRDQAKSPEYIKKIEKKFLPLKGTPEMPRNALPSLVHGEVDVLNPKDVSKLLTEDMFDEYERRKDLLYKYQRNSVSRVPYWTALRLWRKWKPIKKLNPVDMETLRKLYEEKGNIYTKEILAVKFGISLEAVKRILKSKFRRIKDGDRVGFETVGNETTIGNDVEEVGFFNPQSQNKPINQNKKKDGLVWEKEKGAPLYPQDVDEDAVWSKIGQARYVQTVEGEDGEPVELPRKPFYRRPKQK